MPDTNERRQTYAHMADDALHRLVGEANGLVPEAAQLLLEELRAYVLKKPPEVVRLLKISTA